MTKHEMIATIRREAQQRGGRIGVKAFVAATGIDEKQIIGKHWAKWNDALVEAGIATNTFHRPRTEEKEVLEAVAQLIERLGKWPTLAELSLARQGDSSFPSLNVIRRMRSLGGLEFKVHAHCSGRPDLVKAKAIASSKSSATGSTQLESTPRASIQGYVYLMRSGRRYKIGRTNSPSRRHREVRLDLPEPTNLVHSIPTDDPQGIEAYWHHRFDSKRVRDTEFFALDSADVAAFKYRKYQ